MVSISGIIVDIADSHLNAMKKMHFCFQAYCQESETWLGWYSYNGLELRFINTDQRLCSSLRLKAKALDWVNSLLQNVDTLKKKNNHMVLFQKVRRSESRIEWWIVLQQIELKLTLGCMIYQLRSCLRKQLIQLLRNLRKTLCNWSGWLEQIYSKKKRRWKKKFS